MGWSEIRIQQYVHGEKATWLEKRLLEHANPVHLVFQAMGVPLLIAGIWIHNWGLMIAGGVLNVIGHLYCWTKRTD